MRYSFTILACMAICSITACAAENNFLTVPYRGGVSIEDYQGQESHIEVPSTLGGRPVLKIDEWVFKGSRIRSLSLPSTLLQMSEKAMYGCRNLEYILFNGMLPKQEEPFSGLSGTLPEVRVWTGCTAQEPGTTYRGLQLTILPGTDLPRVERQDHAPGNLFENSLQLIFPNQANGFILHYTTGFAEPQNTSATISGEATKTLSQSTRLALRWFTSDGQPASGVKRIAFGRIDNNPPHALEDFTVRACYCQGSEGRLEIEDYHGQNPVVRIPATLGGKAVYNLCSSGLWNLNCLAVIMPPGLAHCGYHFDSCAELEFLEFPQGLRRLTDGTARNCSQLRKVVLPDSLLEIGQEAFAGCLLLNDLILPNQLLTIEADAFSDCHSLSSVVFPANLRQIGHRAFRNCQALTEVTFLGAPPSRMNDQPIFEDSAITKINALSGMGWEDVFEGIPVNLIDAIIPVISGLTNDDGDFFDDSLTVEISIPEPEGQLPFIRYTLDGSTPTPESNLFEVPFVLQQDCIVTAWAFLLDQPAGPPVTRTFVKTSSNQFQYRFFYDEEANCWQYRGGEAILPLPPAGKFYSGLAGDPERGGTLRSIFIPAGVQNLNGTADIGGATAENPFLNQRILHTITVDDENAVYKTRDGVLFDQQGTTLIAWPAAKQQTVYAIPETVHCIAAGAFAFAQHLRKIIIPDTVENIGEGAFREMQNLQEVRLPEGLKVLTPYLFQNCRSLTTLTLPDGLNGIGRHALEGCQNLAVLDLPRFLKHIGSSAFRKCTALEELIIPAGIQSLAISAFFECRKGLTVSFAGNIDTAGACFYGEPTATNPDTGTNLLNPMVIKYWEFVDNNDYDPYTWQDRFMLALFGWFDSWPNLEGLISFEPEGEYQCPPPDLNFRLSENSSRSHNAPTEIRFSGYAPDDNVNICYTLDGSEPHPDNANALTAHPVEWYYQNWNDYYECETDWLDAGELPLLLRARIFDGITNTPLSFEQWLLVSWSDTPVFDTRMIWDQWESCLYVDCIAGRQLDISHSWTPWKYEFYYEGDTDLQAEYAILDYPNYWQYCDRSDLRHDPENELNIDVYIDLVRKGEDPRNWMPVELSRNFCRQSIDWNNDNPSRFQPHVNLESVIDRATEFRLEDPDDSGPYHIDDGVLYYQNRLLAYPGAKTGNRYEILDGTEIISQDAFTYNRLHSWDYNPDWIYNEKTDTWEKVLQYPPPEWEDLTLQEVIVPASVTEIEDGAFRDCRHLKTVKFLGKPPLFNSDEIFPSPAEWGDSYAGTVYAFPGCGWEAMKNRWQNRVQQLQEDLSEDETWEDFIQWSDEWTFFGAVDLIIDGAQPPEFFLQNETLGIRCLDAQGSELSPENYAIFYTSDGTTPSEETSQYSAPFALPVDCRSVQAAVFYKNGDGQASPVAIFTVEEPEAPGDPEAAWLAAQINTPDGREAWQVPGNNAAENRFRQTFNDPGTLSFWWKMDSSAAQITLLHNGRTILMRHAYLPWEYVELAVHGEGNHAFTWIFTQAPADALPCANTAWLGGIHWNSAANPPPYYQLTVLDGGVSGLYQPGQSVELLADIVESASFKRWSVIAGQAQPPSGNLFIMPNQDVTIQAVFNFLHTYTLQPGWNLLGSNWDSLEINGDAAEQTIFTHDQKKQTFIQKKLCELAGIQGFWMFNSGTHPYDLELAGELANPDIPIPKSWSLQPGSTIPENAAAVYQFDAGLQQYRQIPPDQELSPWQGFWQASPDH